MSKKNYMFLFRGGQYDGLSPEQVQQGMQKWFDWIDKLKGNNVYKAGEPLEKGGVVLSQREEKLVLDGPYAESKELIGGYFILQLSNMDEAVETAREYPDFPLGGKVEIREILPLPTR